MTEALKPCPFCDGDSVELHPLRPITHVPSGLGGPLYAHCNGCGAEGPQHDTEAEAVAAWNTRSEGHAPERPVERGELMEELRVARQKYADGELGAHALLLSIDRALAALSPSPAPTCKQPLQVASAVDRRAMARIIDPEVWWKIDNILAGRHDEDLPEGWTREGYATSCYYEESRDSLAKADQIIAALSPSPADRGEGDQGASQWRPISEAPAEPGAYINVRSTATYRYLPYKPDGARQMRKAGRWQRVQSEYGGWANAELPENADFVLNQPRNSTGEG